MKRITCLLMVFVLFALTSTTTFAVSINEESLVDARIVDYVEAKIDALDSDISIVNTKTIHDFAGNEYKVVECTPKGYFIIHPDSGIILEYTTKAISPYSGIDESNAYYSGPTYYYIKSNDVYTHAVLDTELNPTDIKKMTQQCQSYNNELMSQQNMSITQYITGETNELPENHTTASSNVDYWVTGYTWFKNLEEGFGYYCPSGSNGICGYIALNLLLKYHHYRGNISLPNSLSTLDSTVLTATLRQQGIYLGYSDSTWAAELVDIIDTFCSSRSISGDATWAIGVSGVINEIELNQRPSILCGDMAGSGNHVIVAYGTNEYENPGYTTYICHYGWDKDAAGNTYSEVHVYGGTSLFANCLKFDPAG